MSMFTTPKSNPATILIEAYLASGGQITVKTKAKAKVKTFLNCSNRGVKSRTLRSQGFAKSNG